MPKHISISENKDKLVNEDLEDIQSPYGTATLGLWSKPTLSQQTSLLELRLGSA